MELRFHKIDSLVIIMKKALLTGIAELFLATGTASAFTFEKDNTCAVVQKTTDMRWGPSTKDKVVKKLKRGDHLEVADTSGATNNGKLIHDWLLVSDVSDSAGWVYSKHVTIILCSHVRPE